MSKHQFIVESHQLEGSVLVLRGVELRHLHVRRIRVDEVILVTDGRGRQREGVVTRVGRDDAEIRLLDDVGAERPDGTRAALTIAIALIKPASLDLVVEKSTELGVDAIQLFTSARSLPSITAARLDRIDRLAISATKQSGRDSIPAIRPPIPLAELLSDNAAVRLLFFEDAAGSTPSSYPNTIGQQPIHLIIGPEGGFTPAEIELARSARCIIASLGKRILRAETAAIAALSVCQFLRGDLGGTIP